MRASNNKDLKFASQDQQTHLHASVGKKGLSKEDKVQLKAKQRDENHHNQQHILKMESIALKFKVKITQDNKKIYSRYNKLEKLSSLIKKANDKNYIDLQEE